MEIRFENIKRNAHFSDEDDTFPNNRKIGNKIKLNVGFFFD